MLSQNPLAFLRDQLEQHTPPALRPIAHDLKTQVKRLIPQGDFVSREQFLAQQALLEQALKRIEILEQQLKSST